MTYAVTTNHLTLTVLILALLAIPLALVGSYQLSSVLRRRKHNSVGAIAFVCFGYSFF